MMPVPRIILCHGYSGSAEDLVPLAVALTARWGAGSVQNPPLPGHGRGEVPPFDLERFGSILAPMLKEAAAAGPLVLAGHSTGGIILLNAVVRTGVRPALLVLAATPRMLPADSGERWDRHRQGAPAIPFSAMAALVSAVNHVGDRRPGGKFPVLVLHGREDLLVPASGAYGWKDGVFEGPVTIVTLPGLGHELFAGPSGQTAVTSVLRGIEDSLLWAQVPDPEDARRRLVELEPGLDPFFDGSPISVAHMALSPMGRNAMGTQREFDPEKDPLVSPVMANIEVTTRCGAACRNCARSFFPQEPRDMDRGLFSAVLEALPHAWKVTLVGLGEPLHHPDLETLVRDASSRKRRVGLVTNGMELTEARGRGLLDAGLLSLALSLDETDPVRLRSLRPGTDAARVLDNARVFGRMARSVPGFSFAVFTAASRENLPYLEEILAVAASLQPSVLVLTDLNFPANEARSLRAMAPEAEGVLRRAVKRAFSAGLPVLTIHALEELGLYRRWKDFLVMSPREVLFRPPRRRHCSTVWQTAAVNVDGKLYRCDCQPEAAVGPVSASSGEDPWKGPAMAAFRAALAGPVPPFSCASCPRL